MKTIINFTKRAFKEYFRMSAQNYTWMWTGCTYIPPKEDTKES
jgi:hypothetical protein